MIQSAAKCSLKKIQFLRYSLSKLQITERSLHEMFGDVLVPNQIKGIYHLKEARLNKGLCFNLEERQALGIHGLQPPVVRTVKEQLELCKLTLEHYKNPLNKYLYLMQLQERNERLFFRLLNDNIQNLMPIVYTPTIGLVCQRFGYIYSSPLGLFISINDANHVYDVIKNWPEPNVRAVCVTDGERILGLGDLGAHGMGIPVGKLSLYTALAGIQPHQCLPVLLDVGTNNAEVRDDPLYIGLRQERVNGNAYLEFIDEFMEAVVKRYGPTTLIHFEDFAYPNAFNLLERYQDCYCTFNDDIQGTAAVIVGGLFASSRITGKKFSDNTILLVGAGQASIGVGLLCAEALIDSGLTEKEAYNKLWMCDVHGLLTNQRVEGDLGERKEKFVKDYKPIKNLEDMIADIKPTILIGASSQPGLFSQKILELMAANNEHPIVFALSNPTSHAECTAEQAFTYTKGRVIFSSGSPFPPVNYNGKIYQTGQSNNAYIFPAMALAVMTTRANVVPNEMFLVAAKLLADCVSDEDIKHRCIYPKISELPNLSLNIAEKLVDYAFENGIATYGRRPDNYRKWIKSQQYNFNYESSLPLVWKWPKQLDRKKL